MKIAQKQNRTLGLYKRKLVFFVATFLLVVSGFYYAKTNNINADVSDLSGNVNTKLNTFEIKVLENGKIAVNGKVIKQRIGLYADYDELRLPVMDTTGIPYDKVQITVIFPADITSEVKTDFLAVHGVESTSTIVQNSSTIVYTAKEVSSQAILTVVAKLPKGTISPTLDMRINQFINDIQNNVWIALAVVFPFLTIVFMILLLVYQHKRQKIDQPTEEITAPPMAIPPAIVGVLYGQKVGSRELAATLIDLAQRGDIVILDEERDFAFGKGRFDQRLLDYEKILLSKIFRKNLTSNRQEIERRINNHFYSKKISLVAAGIYSLATQLGYFKVNPQKYHNKYRLIGVFLFLLALAGFVMTLAFFSSPSYVVFLWIGMMGSSLIIAFTAGSLPIRTVIGQEVLSNWLSFRKFLSNPNVVPFAQNNQEIFQRYLPYAVVMNCEAAWARRFSEHNFVMPEWFLTDKGNLGLEDFCLSLFPIVSYVGRNFAAIREPGFE